MDSKKISKRVTAFALAAVTLAQIPLMGAAQELTDSTQNNSTIASQGTTYTTDYDVLMGDLSGNGRVSIEDALMIVGYLSGSEKLTEDAYSVADVNFDGVVNTNDSLCIVRYVAGADTTLGGTAAEAYYEALAEAAAKAAEEAKATDSDDTDSVINLSVTDYTYTSVSDTDEDSGDSYADTANASEDSSLTVSGTSYTVPAGMTLYVTADEDVTWSSSDTSIATVDENGLILAKSEGTVSIVAQDGDSKRTIKVTVTEAEAVRTAYASPNSAAKGSTVTLIATTDQTRTAVKFEVDINGTTQTVTATDKTADNTYGIYTWTAEITATTAGTFDVTAYSKKDGTWSTCENGETTMFVSSNTSSSTASTSTLRASDDVISLIAQYEGGLSEAEYDPLASGSVMNYGYGVVISAGTTFYNNASMDEYFADLVNQINEGSYSSYVNNFLQENNIKYNQQQFDALVSFVYNLGVYSLQNSSIKAILLDCYEDSSSASSASASQTATVTMDGGLNLRTGAGTTYSIIGVLDYGETVTVVDSTRVNTSWVKVMTSDGTVGYCSSNYLNFSGSSSSSSGTRNLSYVDTDALVEELLEWHHAGGVCYWGLLYRRIDELELFIYGDYEKDGSSNKYSWTYPDCIA